MEGTDARPDYRRAAEWLRKASDQGHGPAMATLAMLHQAGRGVEQDDAAMLRETGGRSSES